MSRTDDKFPAIPGRPFPFLPGRINENEYTSDQFVDESRRPFAVFRSNGVEPVENLFKRGFDNLDDVLDSSSYGRTVTSYLASGKVNRLFRSSVDELPDNLFKRGVNDLNDVLDSTTYGRVASAYRNTSGFIILIYNAGVSQPTDNVFIRGVNTLADVLGGTTGVGATGTWPISVSGNAATASTATTATRLATGRSIWGQTFDGSADVSGAFSGASTGVFSSYVNASDFVLGDGTGEPPTGAGSPITVQDEGSTLTSDVGTFNFVGAGVSASAVGGVVTVDITGAVTSVFGRTGAVVAAANDYTFAQLASKPTSLAGYGVAEWLVPSSTGFVHDEDTVLTSGVYYVASVGGDLSHFGQTDGGLLHMAYPGDPGTWGSQIYQDYRTGQLSVRGRASAAWTTWYDVLTTKGGQTIAGVTVSGQMFAQQGVFISGNTGLFSLSGTGQANVSTSTTDGLQLNGWGSSYDIRVLNKNSLDVFTVATGTQIMTLHGALSAAYGVDLGNSAITNVTTATGQTFFVTSSLYVGYSGGAHAGSFLTMCYNNLQAWLLYMNGDDSTLRIRDVINGITHVNFSQASTAAASSVDFAVPVSFEYAINAGSMGWAIGGLVNVQRIQYGSSLFAFLNAGNAYADIAAYTVTANGMLLQTGSFMGRFEGGGSVLGGTGVGVEIWNAGIQAYNRTTSAFSAFSLYAASFDVYANTTIHGTLGATGIIEGGSIVQADSYFRLNSGWGWFIRELDWVGGGGNSPSIAANTGLGVNFYVNGSNARIGQFDSTGKFIVGNNSTAPAYSKMFVDGGAIHIRMSATTQIGVISSLDNMHVGANVTWNVGAAGWYYNATGSVSLMALQGYGGTNIVAFYQAPSGTGGTAVSLSQMSRLDFAGIWYAADFELT